MGRRENVHGQMLNGQEDDEFASLSPGWPVSQARIHRQCHAIGVSLSNNLFLTFCAASQCTMFASVMSNCRNAPFPPPPPLTIMATIHCSSKRMCLSGILRLSPFLPIDTATTRLSRLYCSPFLTLTRARASHTSRRQSSQHVCCLIS